MPEKREYVKLRDKGGIFHDITQPDLTLTGDAVVNIKRSNKVETALRSGVLEKATEAEYNDYTAQSKQQEEAKAEPLKKKETYQGSQWSRDALVAELDKRGIEYPQDATKSKLMFLLVEDDSKK